MNKTFNNNNNNMNTMNTMNNNKNKYIINNQIKK